MPISSSTHTSAIRTRFCWRIHDKYRDWAFGNCGIVVVVVVVVAICVTAAIAAVAVVLVNTVQKRVDHRSLFFERASTSLEHQHRSVSRCSVVQGAATSIQRIREHKIAQNWIGIGIGIDIGIGIGIDIGIGIEIGIGIDFGIVGGELGRVAFKGEFFE